MLANFRALIRPYASGGAQPELPYRGLASLIGGAPAGATAGYDVRSHARTLAGSTGPDAAISNAVSGGVAQHLPLGVSPVGHKFGVRTLLDARVHLGHRTRLWNPKMAPYILGDRNGLHIINLDKTMVMLRRALSAVASMAEDGCSFLWLGPGDSQKSRLVSNAAAEAGSYVIDGRWVGGTLTNPIESGQAAKLDYRTPDCVFVIDMLRHAPALREARSVGIPVVGIADTDCNPEMLTYPIPGNDDGVHAVNLYCHLMRLAILDGRRRSSPSRRLAAA